MGSELPLLPVLLPAAAETVGGAPAGGGDTEGAGATAAGAADGADIAGAGVTGGTGSGLIASVSLGVSLGASTLADCDGGSAAAGGPPSGFVGSTLALSLGGAS